MKAIILAAGIGARMDALTRHTCKPMLHFNGRPIIHQMLENLSLAGIREAVIITGHKSRQLIESVGVSFCGIAIEYVENPRYNTANNIVSLWLAREYLITTNTLLIEGDLILDPDILCDILKLHGNVAAVAPLTPAMNGSILEISNNGEIELTTTAKTSSTEHLKYKTVNIYKLTPQFCRDVYLPLMEEAINKGHTHIYYENVLTGDIFRKYFFLSVVQPWQRWIEVDKAIDLQHAATLFDVAGVTYNDVVGNYGGFWRFPHINDHLYLNNPYFPNKRLMQDMNSRLPELIVNYPSGSNRINMLAATAFSCAQENIFTGNGGCEIIRLFLNMVPGKVGVILPTFDEYINAVEPGRVVTCEASGPDFQVSDEMIMNLAGQVAIMVLVNPNNPIGAVIEPAVIRKLLKYLRQERKYLVLDESFIDFAEKDCYSGMSLIDEFDNLFIIKSLGKSFGIPGLRAGVMFSGNKELIRQMIKQAPIWNINAMVEHFLEIFPDYTEAYLNACRAVMNDRNYLMEELAKIPYLVPLPSQANFVLCKVKKEFISATALSSLLLERYSILIKDCTGKLGMEDDNYDFVRIGIKDKTTNYTILNAMKLIQKQLQPVGNDVVAEQTNYH